MREGPRGLAASSSASESGCSHMALTWSFESRSMPIAAATPPCTLLVLVPVAHVSPAAPSNLWQRPIPSSGKKPPVRSLGIPGASVPTRVTRPRSR